MASDIRFPTASPFWNGISPSSGVWNNRTNALTSDGSYAAASVGASDGISMYLYLSDFGFGSTILPGATIEGIVAEFNLYSDYNVCNVFSVMLATSDTTTVGSDMAAFNTIFTSPTPVTFGGPTNNWGVALTQSMVTSPGFGVVISVISGESLFDTPVYVDYGNLTIYYSGGSAVAYNFAGSVLQGAIPTNYAF